MDIAAGAFAGTRTSGPGWKPVPCKEKAGSGREGGVTSGSGSAIHSRTHERRAHVAPWCAPLSMMNPPA